MTCGNGERKKYCVCSKQNKTKTHVNFLTCAFIEQICGVSTGGQDDFADYIDEVAILLIPAARSDILHVEWEGGCCIQIWVILVRK